jgi:raffinose/stachyose/melibiose transport system substrate-binding protein
MLKNSMKIAFLAAIGISAMAAHASAGKLVIESWRNDDATIWKEQIIPAFQKAHPDIQVEFAPTAPKEYNAALNAKLQGGTAGDIITCRPFDASLELFNKGYLAPVNDLASMTNFSDVAKSAWTTDDGKTTFCVPMGSVIHGFIYNKDIFKELALTEPKNSSASWKRSRPPENIHHSFSAPRINGKPQQWASKTLDPTIGRVKQAAKLSSMAQPR